VSGIFGAAYSNPLAKRHANIGGNPFNNGGTGFFDSRGELLAGDLFGIGVVDDVSSIWSSWRGSLHSNVDNERRGESFQMCVRIACTGAIV